jgi:predicted nucleic acid-binding protein
MKRVSMPERLVLDTNIVIDLLKKSPALVSSFLALTQAGTRFLLSPIVVAEVYAGAFEREHKAVEALFGFCQRVDLDHATGQQAGLYAKEFAKAYHGIAMEDFLLAATAHTCRCPLWTHNRKHYPMKDIVLFEP